MPKYLLDTNMVSNILRQQPNVMARVETLPTTAMAISILTLAEIQYGFAKKPEAVKLRRLFETFLLNIEILPFDETISAHYALFRANVEKQGKSLAPLDMLIAAHTDAIEAILVSNDRAFAKIAGLQVEDWTMNSV